MPNSIKIQLISYTMYKINGYNPKDGDWFWVKYTPYTQWQTCQLHRMATGPGRTTTSYSYMNLDRINPAGVLPCFCFRFIQ